MLKTYIDLANYEKLERKIKQHKGRKPLILFDEQDKVPQSEALAKHLTQHIGKDVTIIRVPEEAKIILIANEKA